MKRPDRNSKEYSGQFGEHEYLIDLDNYYANLEEKLDKQSEIIKVLREALEKYASSDTLTLNQIDGNVETMEFCVDIKYSTEGTGELARQALVKVREMEKV